MNPAALEPRVRSTRPQADERIDDKRQLLPHDLDLLDRIGGGHLVDRRERDDRLALVDRLAGERLLALRVRGDPLAEVGDDVGRRRKLVGGQDAFHARHRERFARIDPLHARVRIRAEQQLAEQHAVSAEIFGVLRLARHLCDEIRRDVVLAD